MLFIPSLLILRPLLSPIYFSLAMSLSLFPAKVYILFSVHLSPLLLYFSASTRIVLINCYFSLLLSLSLSSTVLSFVVFSRHDQEKKKRTITVKK